MAYSPLQLKKSETLEDQNVSNEERLTCLFQKMHDHMSQGWKILTVEELDNDLVIHLGRLTPEGIKLSR